MKSTIANQEYLRKLYQQASFVKDVFESPQIRAMNQLTRDSKVNATCIRLDSLQDQIRGDLGDDSI